MANCCETQQCKAKHFLSYKLALPNRHWLEWLTYHVDFCLSVRTYNDIYIIF